MTHEQKFQASHIKTVFKKVGQMTSRQNGQNFLVCPQIAKKIADITKESAAHAITELGAGLGALTDDMLAAGMRVRAIERDKTLLQVLKEGETAGNSLEVIEGDLRKEIWAQQMPYQIVGNIPYNLSGWIVRRITQLNPQPDQVVLIVQREVGERLAASPPQMSLIGLAAQLWGRVEYVHTISADCFWPKPKVQSAIVRIIPQNTEQLTPIRREEVLALAKLCFQNKRKQMGGVLAKEQNVSLEVMQDMLVKAGIKAEQRPQELAVKQWVNLYHTLYSK